MIEPEITVIREDDGSITIPMRVLLGQHRITRCNVGRCVEHPNTILLITCIPGMEVDSELYAGCCETHYQAAKALGRWDYTLEFSNP